MRAIIKINKYLSLLPTGIFICFLILFWCIARYYPGGTRFDSSTLGFSFKENYWCDLMIPMAFNGDVNPVYHIAIISWVVVCIALGFFFYMVPVLFDRYDPSHRYIQILGILAFTGVALAIIGPWHDQVVYYAFLPAAAATILGIRCFILEHMYFYAALLIGMQLLCLYDWISYLTKFQEMILPAIQKITFAICTIILAYFNWKIYLKMESQ